MHKSLNTFMQSPAIGINDIHRYDVVVLGVPVDWGVSYRSGQKYAPKVIREHSFWHRLDGKIIHDFNLGKQLKANALSIGDLGDVHIRPGDANLTNQEITKVVQHIRTTSFPLILGGDHSITYGAFVGCKRTIDLRGDLPLGILHFDAHVDTEAVCGTLPPIHHGNVIGELIKAGHVQGQHVVSLGTRGYETKDWVDYADSAGVNRLTVRDIRAKSIEQVVQELMNTFKGRCRSVYVTFDMDCIDPSEAPGTGTPVFEGLRLQEIFPIIHSLNRLPVVAFDLVELSPPLDPSGLTAVAACEILYWFLAFGLSESKRQGIETKD